MKVLLIEDNMADIQLLKYHWGKINPKADFYVYQDADEAIIFLNGWDEIIHLNLIVIDINLPKTSGIEILKIIKAMPKFEKAIVALYSSSNEPELIKSVYDAGADYFMNKAVSLDEYFSEVSALYAACVGSRN